LRLGSGDADRLETGRFRPLTSRCPASRAILGQLAAAYKGEVGFRQLPAMPQSPKNLSNMTNIRGFRGFWST
jgi:hypothetical protein